MESFRNAGIEEARKITQKIGGEIDKDDDVVWDRVMIRFDDVDLTVSVTVYDQDDNSEFDFRYGIVNRTDRGKKPLYSRKNRNTILRLFRQLSGE
jgi:hypothetical protein